MCGKLPTGSVGFVPSGSAPAASGSGVPHQGGASVSARAAPAHVSATALNSTPRPSRSDLLSLVDTSFHLLGRSRPAAGSDLARPATDFPPRAGRLLCQLP